MAHVPLSRNPQATPTEIAANSPSPRDLKPGVVLPWEGPSLTRGILPPVEPRFGETKHRKLESVLVGDYGPAGKARSEPWTLRLVGTLGHAALQGSEQHASQIWKCSAKRGKTPTEISVVLKLYVPPLESRISRYERTPPVRKTSRIDHKMKWDEGKNLIDREAMVYKLLRDRQGMKIPYCYGLYKFELGGEVCEGFVLEDLSEFTKSVRDWFVQKQGRGKLDTGQFGTLMSAALETQEAFFRQDVSDQHPGLHKLFVAADHAEKNPQVIALGFNKAQHRDEVEEGIALTKKRKPSAPEREWTEAAEEALRNLFAHALSEQNRGVFADWESFQHTARRKAEWPPA